MQLPSDTSSPSTRVRFGRYVARRLKTAGRSQLAADVASATLAVKTAARVVDDRDDEIQDPLADRDAADDALDRAAQELRTALLGRSVDAAKVAPYVNIFPDGIGAYTAAPLDAEVARYTELKSRVEKELPATDAARVAVVVAISAGLQTFTTAVAAVDAARTALSLAQTDLDRATDAWERLLEKVYGTLIAEVGKGAAEDFFPPGRTRTRTRPTE
jgi:hypothetical protein